MSPGMELETLLVDRRDDGVAVVTLNRPEHLNAFTSTMVEELSSVWRGFRDDDAVRCVVLTGAGDRAFCTGLDRSEVPVEDYTLDPYSYEDPGRHLGPKSNGLWKPVIGAVNGLAGGGAFYLLADCDFLIAAEEASFLDPHVSYGMPAVYEPALMSRLLPFGDLMRLTLTGVDERLSARRAYELGMVTEVVPRVELSSAALEVAAVVASQPAAAVQASVRSLWATRDLTPNQVVDLGGALLNLGWDLETQREGQERFASGQRRRPRVR